MASDRWADSASAEEKEEEKMDVLVSLSSFKKYKVDDLFTEEDQRPGPTWRHLPLIFDCCCGHRQLSSAFLLFFPSTMNLVLVVEVKS
jgi:hypothetical protein